MNPKDVATAAVAVFADVPGIEAALTHDDDQLPALPAVTLAFAGANADDRYTGPAEEMTWTWVVRLYLPFGGNIVGNDIAAVDDKLYDLVPRLYHAIRVDPGLGGVTIWARLDDPGEEEPDRDEEAGIAIKHLRLRARTEEV